MIVAKARRHYLVTVVVRCAISGSIWRAIGEVIKDSLSEWPQNSTTACKCLLAGGMTLVDLLLIQVLLRVSLICKW